jgi:hypothetical protein
MHLGPMLANGSIVPLTAPFRALELDFCNLPPRWGLCICSIQLSQALKLLVSTFYSEM